MDDKTKSKKKLSVVLGLSGVALAGGIAWILLGSGESSMLVSSDLMESDETSSESSEETIPNLELAATDQTTDGLRFVVNGNSFVATGQAAPETMAILEPLITLAYSTNGTNSIETNTELQPNPYDQSIAGLVQLMATNIEFGDIEITDTTVTLSGEAPSEEFKSKFADFLGPESGFDQEIVNNITVVDKGFSNIAIVHTDEKTTVDGVVKTEEIRQIITTSSTEFFGEDVEIDVTVDETLFAGFTWGRFPESVGGLLAFDNWEAGSINNNPFLTLTLTFETGSANLAAQDAENLIAILPIMFTSEGTITVTGHTDNVGSAAANQVLSEQRAQTVVNTLIGLAAAATGAPAESFQDTFIAEGRGSSQPVADNSTEAGKALNRRVTFQINRR